MGENLRAVTLSDGTKIPMIKDMKEWENAPGPAYCYFDNDKKAYRNTYGPLYNWAAVNTGKLCPVGWHVPSDAEWDTLELFLDPGIDTVIFSRKPVAVFKMRNADDWMMPDSAYGTNESGFTALPGGSRTIYGVFLDVGTSAGWWSSTESQLSPADAISREIRKEDESYKLYDFRTYKQFGLSVRCIKNQDQPEP
jgi:uncharacterized protein (TIGR02145 family)